MKEKSTLINVLFYILGITLIVLLKSYYSHADVTSLDWILLPTSRWVSLLTGLAFIETSTMGYISTTEQVAINASCSGINLLIILYSTYYFVFIHRIQSSYKKLAWVFLVPALSYCTTILVNGIRIALSIWLKYANVYNDWMTYDRVHRILGIGLYVIVILIIYYVIDYIMANRSRHRLEVFYPVTGYLLVTIGIPLVRNASLGNSGLFIEHSLTILIIAVPLSLLARYFQSVVS